MRLLIIIPIIACLGACSPGPASLGGAPPPLNTAVRLSPAQKQAIGQKIWQNESGGSVAGLTAWNNGENFPSLGIGHFIWYPAGVRGPFTESFPQFIDYARRRGLRNIPPIAQQRSAPWPNKAAFDRARGSTEMTSLRNWLAANVGVQTDFIIQKSRAALPKILAAAPPADRARVQRNYDAVSSTANGMYALIDYVNFKGEGTNPSERYAGQGWGLLQVLQEMRGNPPKGQAAAREFSAAAKRVLSRRIANAPRNESRWRAGWHNRCNTYAQPL